MRPSPDSADEELYECFDCGERVEDPTTRSCGSCGGNLRNVSRARDL